MTGLQLLQALLRLAEQNADILYRRVVITGVGYGGDQHPIASVAARGGVTSPRGEPTICIACEGMLDASSVNCYADVLRRNRDSGDSPEKVIQDLIDYLASESSIP